MYLRTCFEKICENYDRLFFSGFFDDLKERWGSIVTEKKQKIREKEASELKLIISNRFSSYKDNIKYGKKSGLFAHIEEMVNRTVAVAYLIVRTGRYRT